MEVVWAHQYDLIDPESIDSQSLEVIKTAEDRVELIFEWIQQLIVENIETGVLSIPPPLLSRSFQELATGMVQFHNAMKIAFIPIPFPYAQTCDFLLILHTVICPFITSQWVTNCLWAVTFTLIQVLVLWSLNLVALEIENPFGKDANDMDGQRMQEEMNRHLLLLVSASTERTPRLSQLFDDNIPTELAQVSSFERVIKAERRRSSLVPSIVQEEVYASQVEAFPSEGAAGVSSITSDFFGMGLSQEPAAHEPLATIVQNARAGQPIDIATSLDAVCSDCANALRRVRLDYTCVCSQCGTASSCPEGGQSDDTWLCTNCPRILCGNCALTDAHAQKVHETRPVVAESAPARPPRPHGLDVLPSRHPEPTWQSGQTSIAACAQSPG